MENASKALLIAGEVLITILVLSVGAYLYTGFSNQSKEYGEIISTTELQKYNSKFDVYEGRTNITAQELATVANIAKEQDISVEIIIYNKSYTKENYDTSEKFITKFINSLFSCISLEYDDTGKIIKVQFKENS